MDRHWPSIGCDLRADSFLYPKSKIFFIFVYMTTSAYNIVKKALLKKKAEVTASPTAAKKFLRQSGLWDVLKDVPADKSGKGTPAKKAAPKKKAA
jgi:hypothetical protein